MEEKNTQPVVFLITALSSVSGEMALPVQWQCHGRPLLPLAATYGISCSDKWLVAIYSLVLCPSETHTSLQGVCDCSVCNFLF